MTSFVTAKYDPARNQILDPNSLGGIASYALDSSGNPTGLVGPNGAAYIGDPIGRMKAIRPKLASFGNSLNGRNQLGETTANYYSAWGFVTWINALTNCGFDRARSSSYSWGAQGSGNSETIDAFGCYAWPGAQLNQAATYSMLNHMPNAIQQFVEVPDVVYLSSMFENDIGLTASPDTTRIIADGNRLIQLFRNAWPNALIIIAAPGPTTSYTTAAQHTSFAAVTAWVAALPVTDGHILVETNTSMILSGTADQPVPSYTSDNIIHQNERGAYVRAKAFVTQFGYLFPNALSIPQLPYNATTPAQSYQRNPTFSVTGAPGQLINGTTYTSYDWYSDTNYTVGTVAANAVGQGVNLTLSATGTVSSGGGVSATSDAQTATVLNSGVYMSAVKIRILNPANLARIEHVVNFSGGVAESHGVFWQSTFLTSYPQGMSDIWVAGDTFTLTSPPLTPGSTNATVAYTQVKPNGCVTLNASTPAASQPSINIITQNVVQVGNNLPSVVALATTVPYTNRSTGLQQIIVSGTATFTALTVTRSGVSVSLPLANGVVTLSPSDILTPTYAAGTPVFTILQMN